MLREEFLRIMEALASATLLTDVFESFQNFDSIAETSLLTFGIIVAIIGLLQCFFGYKLFRGLCALVGFAVGCTIGMALARWLIGFDTTLMTTISMLAVIILGVVFALLAFRVFLAGFFIYAFIAVYSLVFFTIGPIVGAVPIGIITSIIVSILIGIVVIKNERVLIILVTALSGALCAAGSTTLFLPNMHQFLVMALAVVLTLLGFIAQNKSVPRGARRR